MRKEGTISQAIDRWFFLFVLCFFLSSTAACGHRTTPDGKTAETICQAAATDDVSHGLVGYWKLDETSGRTAFDASGNGLDWTYAGGMSLGQPGVVDNAVHMDGSNDEIRGTDPAILAFTSSFTLSAWVNPDTMPAAREYSIINKNGRSRNRDKLLLIDNGANLGTVKFQISLDGTKAVARWSKTAVPTGSWTHVVGRYDNAMHTMDIFINGELDNGAVNGVVPGAIFDGTEEWYLGARDVNGYRLDGFLDEVRIYERALNDSEVVTLARASENRSAICP